MLCSRIAEGLIIINCVAAELLSAAASVDTVFATVFLKKVEIFRCGVHE